MIRGLVDNGLFQASMNLYHRMKCEGIRPDNFTYPFLIKACGRLVSLEDGRKVNAELFKVGLDTDAYVCNSLISMYAENDCIELAENVFHEMRMKDLVSWNSMICGYGLVGDGVSSLSCFLEMQKHGVMPDRYTMMGILSAVSAQCCLLNGKEIHSQIMKIGYELDIMVQTSLIDMYGKCGKMDYAKRLFDRGSKDSVVTWNSMIDGYSKNSLSYESFACLKSMISDYKLAPDCITTINLLPSCAQLGAVMEGKSIHAYSIRKGFVPHSVLETALIHMYGECKELKMARFLFRQMTQKSLVPWNALIATYVHNEHNSEALALFQELLHEPLMLDPVTISTILPAYADVAIVKECNQIHAYAIKLDMVSNNFISNSVIDMYGKCGDLQSARQVFDEIMVKDVVSWNVMMMGYAIHGLGRESLELFSAMKEQNLKPNSSTFVSLLCSCSMSGLVSEGWEYFNLMKTSYNIDPEIDHYGCMVDLIGRTGDLERAKQFIEESGFLPNGRIWGSLLSASRNHKNIEMAEFAADYILSLKHDNTGCYICLSNMYAEAGRLEEAELIRDLMKLRGLKKTTGRSTVQSRNCTRTFIDHDKCHKDTEIIHHVLYIISQRTEEEDTIQDFRSVTKFRLGDLAGERSKSAATHSLRLAVSFGLISTAVGEPVVVRKNKRICESCHSFVKRISRFSGREIVVGDSKVFHHFSHGSCSCGDFW